jgi:hypothetical protein
VSAYRPPRIGTARPLLVPNTAEPRQGDAYSCIVRWEEAKKERQGIEARYDDAIRYAIPGRRGFTIGPDDSEIYDDTAVTHTPEFASNIQAGVMPPFGKWVSHIAGIMIEDQAEREQIAELLDTVDTYVFDMINSSAATGEIHESLIDLAIGTGCLRIDPGITNHPLAVRAVPIRKLWFTIGADGRVDGIFEERCLTASQLDIDYPGIAIPTDNPPPPKPGEPAAITHYKAIEAWLFDWTDPKVEQWKGEVFFPDKNNQIGWKKQVKGDGCCPYVGPFRWSKASGEAWGRGPLFNSLPSLRTVNFAMKALIDHSDLALAGVWTYEDDGVINVDTVRLEPGALIPRAPGSSALQNLRPGQDFDIQQFMLTEMRTNIKRALYADQLGDPERSPKTATEVQHRMALLARAIGSSYGRLIIELVFPFIRRTIRVLKEKGLIKIPRVDGKEIARVPTSPMALARLMEEVDNWARMTELTASRYGPQALAMIMQPDANIKYLAEKFSIPQKLLASQAQQAQTAAATAQATQAMGGAEAGPQPGGETAEEPIV